MKSKNRLRQLDWLIWHLASEQECCFCRQLLFYRYKIDGKLNVTKHHLFGSADEDGSKTKEFPADPLQTLWAHGDCHRKYHILHRHCSKTGKMTSELSQFESNFQKAIKRLKNQNR